MSDSCAYSDVIDLCLQEKDYKTGITVRELIVKAINVDSDADAPELWRLYLKSLQNDAEYCFDAYMQFIEWDREPRNRFYLPRRKALKQAVQGLQDLEDDILDLYCLSLPPGTGKTTLALFYLTWIAGKRPDMPSLTGSHNAGIVEGMYDEALRIMTDSEYNWGKIFPGSSVVSTSAKYHMLDINTPKRFKTLEFTSLGAGNAGRFRAQKLLYCDDLIPGTEVAFNPDSLDKVYQQYTDDLRQRKIGDCKELHIATRWARLDVIGRLQIKAMETPESAQRSRFDSMPALNDNEESNFDYPGTEASFSTKFYLDMRDTMEPTSWNALYMNEPVERSGLLFPEEQLRYYTELPEQEPDAIIALVDTKDKGKDYYTAAVFNNYGGEDWFVADAVCDNQVPSVVEPKVADLLIRNGVRRVRFESNAGGGRASEAVEKRVKELGGTTEFDMPKFTAANKETKILDCSPWIAHHLIFKDKTSYKRNSDYSRFMRFLTNYVVMGKHQKDDSADVCAMAYDFTLMYRGPKYEIGDRLF